MGGTVEIKGAIYNADDVIPVLNIPRWGATPIGGLTRDERRANLIEGFWTGLEAAPLGEGIRWTAGAAPGLFTRLFAHAPAAADDLTRAGAHAAPSFTDDAARTFTHTAPRYTDDTARLTARAPALRTAGLVAGGAGLGLLGGAYLADNLVPRLTPRTSPTPTQTTSPDTGGTTVSPTLELPPDNTPTGNTPPGLSLPLLIGAVLIGAALLGGDHA